MRKKKNPGLLMTLMNKPKPIESDDDDETEPFVKYDGDEWDICKLGKKKMKKNPYAKLSKVKSSTASVSQVAREVERQAGSRMYKQTNAVARYLGMPPYGDTGIRAKLQWLDQFNVVYKPTGQIFTMTENGKILNIVSSKVAPKKVSQAAKLPTGIKSVSDREKWEGYVRFVTNPTSSPTWWAIVDRHHKEIGLATVRGNQVIMKIEREPKKIFKNFDSFKNYLEKRRVYVDTPSSILTNPKAGKYEGKPPREWFTHVVAQLKKDRKTNNPAQLAGWIWHHQMHPRTRDIILKEIKKNRRMGNKAIAITAQYLKYRGKIAANPAIGHDKSKTYTKYYIWGYNIAQKKWQSFGFMDNKDQAIKKATNKVTKGWWFTVTTHKGLTVWESHLPTMNNPDEGSVRSEFFKTLSARDKKIFKKMLSKKVKQARETEVQDDDSFDAAEAMRKGYNVDDNDSGPSEDFTEKIVMKHKPHLYYTIDPEVEDNPEEEKKIPPPQHPDWESMQTETAHLTPHYKKGQLSHTQVRDQMKFQESQDLIRMMTRWKAQNYYYALKGSRGGKKPVIFSHGPASFKTHLFLDDAARKLVSSGKVDYVNIDLIKKSTGKIVDENEAAREMERKFGGKWKGTFTPWLELDFTRENKGSRDLRVRALWMAKMRYKGYYKNKPMTVEEHKKTYPIAVEIRTVDPKTYTGHISVLWRPFTYSSTPAKAKEVINTHLKGKGSVVRIVDTVTGNIFSEYKPNPFVKVKKPKIKQKPLGIQPIQGWKRLPAYATERQYIIYPAGDNKYSVYRRPVRGKKFGGLGKFLGDKTESEIVLFAGVDWRKFVRSAQGFKNNPGRTIMSIPGMPKNPSKELLQGIKLYHNRHGVYPSSISTVKVPKGYPKVGVPFGMTNEITYKTPKHTNRKAKVPNAWYKHKFENKAWTVTNASGKGLFIVHPIRAKKGYKRWVED